MKRMNSSIKSVVVLVAICFVVTALLAGVNFVTAPIIAEANEEAAKQSLFEVLPQAEDFTELSLPENAPKTVTGVYADTAGSGYAVTLDTSSQYSADNMLFTIGIDADGKIAGVTLTHYSESKDFGADYPSTYIGKDASLSGVDTVAGVTYSSAAFKEAVADAFAALTAAKEAE